jgi:hypothetical protein
MKKALYLGASTLAVSAAIVSASAASMYGTDGYKDGLVYAPVAERQGRPDPTKYSFKIWPVNGIKVAGARVSADTEFGLLTCKGDRHAKQRVCWWGHGPR